MYLAIYLLLVMVTQFLINASIISSTCGGNITENMGAAGVFTFLPWTLIFGVIIIILTIYPGFKSAFSDVIGYFYVSGQANKILTTLLIDRDIQNKIDTDTELTPEKKESMQKAIDAIESNIKKAEDAINKAENSSNESFGVDIWTANALLSLVEAQLQNLEDEFFMLND